METTPISVRLSGITPCACAYKIIQPLSDLAHKQSEGISANRSPAVSFQTKLRTCHTANPIAARKIGVIASRFM